MTEQKAQPGLGDLWRDVANVLGDTPITPATILPLLEEVAPRWASEHHFMQFVARAITTANERREIEAEVGNASIGWRLWREQRETLWAWMKQASKEPVEIGDLFEWWLGGHRRLMVLEEQDDVDSFIAAIDWTLTG